MKNRPAAMFVFLLVVFASDLTAQRALTSSSVLEILTEKEMELLPFSNPWYLSLSVRVHDEAHAAERLIPLWEVRFRDRLVEIGILEDKTVEDWDYSRYDSRGYRYREYRGAEHRYSVLKGYPGIEESGGRVALFMIKETVGRILDLPEGTGARVVTVEIIPRLTDVFWEVGSIIRSTGGLAQQWESEVSEQWRTENPGRAPDWMQFPEIADPQPRVAQFQFFPNGDQWEVIRIR